MASEVLTRTLYGGLVTVVHNPNARGRQPRYLVNNEKKPKGVTTILGQTLNKDLMQWAVDCMAEYLGPLLPMVTESDLKNGASEYKRRRDAGAGAGTEAHAMVEQFLKGGKPSIENASQEARNAYGAFVTWFEQVKPEIIGVEEVIYSMTRDYAGTYDCMLKIDDKVYLCDLKTTNASRKAPNGVYAENFLQLGAYASAHEENRAHAEASGDTSIPKVEGLMVISARKDGSLAIATNEQVGVSVEECAETFNKVHDIYKFMSSVTTSLGGK